MDEFLQFIFLLMIFIYKMINSFNIKISNTKFISISKIKIDY